MHHLLVERGHAGRSRRLRHDGRAKRVSPRYARDEDGDWYVQPRHQPSFSENLAPLRRYLAAQVGRPWDKVYSEIRARINTGNAVQFHILQHLFDDIAVHVGEDADGLTFTNDNGRIIAANDRWCRYRLYVCPRTGLIRKAPRHDPRKKKTKPLDRLPGPVAGMDYRRIADIWYAAWWGTDKRTGEPIIVRKQQLGWRRLRELGLRTD